MRIYTATIIENINAEIFCKTYAAKTPWQVFMKVKTALETEAEERSVTLDFDPDELYAQLKTGNEFREPYSIDSLDGEYLVTASVLNC